LFGAVAKLAGITFRRLAFSYWIDNLGFLLREKLAAIFIKPCSWGFQLAGHLLHQLHANKFSGTIHHRAINRRRGGISSAEEGDGGTRRVADGSGARWATAARGAWQSERRAGGKFQWRLVGAARGVK
jgi:hypothetical protein